MANGSIEYVCKHFPRAFSSLARGKFETAETRQRYSPRGQMQRKRERERERERERVFSTSIWHVGNFNRGGEERKMG